MGYSSTTSKRNDPEYRRKFLKMWREKNKEKWAEYLRSYREKNRDRINEIARRSANKNQAKRTEYMKQYRLRKKQEKENEKI